MYELTEELEKIKQMELKMEQESMKKSDLLKELTIEYRE